MKKNIWVNVAIIGCTALCIIFLGVFLLAKFSNLKESGSLGDAVNGLSAPIISFFSAILIYITFREQNKANQLLSEQNRFDTFNKLFDALSNAVENLEFTYRLKIEDEQTPVRYINTKGLDAIDAFSKQWNDLSLRDTEKFLTKITLIMEDFIRLSDLAKSSGKEQRIYFQNKLFSYYSGTMKMHFILFTTNFKIKTFSFVIGYFTEVHHRFKVATHTISVDSIMYVSNQNELANQREKERKQQAVKALKGMKQNNEEKSNI